MPETEKNIELELRAEVSVGELKKLFNDLSKKATLVSSSKRLSVMFLGESNSGNLDIRVRVDSSRNAELVVKKGDFHADNRVEICQSIQLNQFIGIVKILTVFGYKAKVTERENFLFDLGNDIHMVLVQAGDIAYVEIEKMSNKDKVEKNRSELMAVISELKLRLVKDGPEFNDLCDRLTKYSDWGFDSSSKSFDKLNVLLANY